MARFPPQFVDELKGQADIVQIVQETVQLRQAGANFKGLCPFHQEKTPSFQVNRERGFFHCFGCGVGGDVVKFVEMRERLSFPEAVQHLAERLGIPMPASDDPGRDAAAEARRTALLKLHELAAAYFQAQLEAAGGQRARAALEARGMRPETTASLGLGFAPPQREALLRHIREAGYPVELALASGLVVERAGGRIVDRFRNRLMFPIRRDNGSVVAFGGRALETDQQPKYLNSPETDLYKKGRMLYGLDVTKTAIRRLGYAVLVEGYFDFAQALQAGVGSVVATCGTALTEAQAALLKRFAPKVILSFDQDSAGVQASVRSGELLLATGLQVNIARLTPGEDPDDSLRKHGAAAYIDKLRHSEPYLEYVLDQAAGRRDFTRDAERRAFLADMLTIAARIPDAATRDQFGDRIAHKARITEAVVRAEIRQAAVRRQTTLAHRRDGDDALRVTPSEQGLIWAVLNAPGDARAVLAGMEAADIEDLATSAILNVARGLADWPADSLPETLLERVDPADAEVARRIAALSAAPAQAADCADALRRRRYEQEAAALQAAIDRRQNEPQDAPAEAGADLDTLLQQKHALLKRIRELDES